MLSQIGFRQLACFEASSLGENVQVKSWGRHVWTEALNAQSAVNELDGGRCLLSQGCRGWTHKIREMRSEHQDWRVRKSPPVFIGVVLHMPHAGVGPAADYNESWALVRLRQR